ncbi:MAG TPA: fibronectin type III domain-containing protein [Syntrophorhabdaceae bacterium]
MWLNHATVKRSARLYPILLALTWCLIFGSSLYLTQGSAHAAQATAKWNSVSNASGYKVYYGSQSRSYSSNVNAGTATTYTVANLAAGTTYYFALTAYNSSGAESGYSSEVSYKTPCTFSISPTSSSIAAAGGTGSVAVTTQTGCAWSVTNGTPWITITSGASGTGNGTVAYSIAANTATTSRSAAITIASNTFSCTQSGTSGTTTYRITASAGAGGAISPAGATVNRGASQTFTITPNSGYRISNVTVDGASVGAVSTYTFTNVTATHTIGASFASSTTSTTRLASLTIYPASVKGGVSSRGTVVLSAAAPSGGAAVSLKSSVWAGVVPASVRVPAGSTSASFTITTSTPYYNTSVVITAAYGSVSKEATLYVTR